MGTKVAPFYANLFMGSHQALHIISEVEFRDNIKLYKHFINDLFLIWKGTDKEASTFVNKLNKNQYGIIFTPKFDVHEIEFLDLLVTQESNGFTTSTYFKPVDTNSYLNFNSYHYHNAEDSKILHS